MTYKLEEGWCNVTSCRAQQFHNAEVAPPSPITTKRDTFFLAPAPAPALNY